MTVGTRGRMALGGLLALGLLALFFRGVDWHALGLAFASASPLYLVGVVLATQGQYVVRSWRWGNLLAPIAKVPFGHLFSATTVGFMTGLLVPRAGELVRPYLVARRHDVATSAAFASIILERLVDLITVLMLFGLYLYALPVPTAQTQGPLLGVLKTAGALAGLLALAVLLALFLLHSRADAVTRAVDRILSRFPERLGGPVSRAVRSFAGGLGVLRASPGHLLAVMGQSVLVWLFIALGVYLNNRAFGLDLPFHTSFLILGFLTVGVAVPTPGMVGGFHASYLLALTQAYGVSRDTAAAAGIASHALTNLPVLVLGLVFLGQEGLSVSRVARMGAEGDGGDGATAEPLPEARH